MSTLLTPQEETAKLAAALKDIPEFQAPEWISFVKSGTSRKRPIEDPDFWYKRSASVLRQIQKKGVVGVSRLRTKYGSKKNRGMQPETFKRASGKILRTILQQADSAGLTEIAQDVKGMRSRRPGRQLTPKGKELLGGLK